MTPEEAIDDLFQKYGEDFNWYIIPFTNKTFVDELKNEIGANHFLYNQQIYAVAKCDSNDDVLYSAGNEEGVEVYYIFHLTYSKENCIFRKNCASVPKERSAIPLETEQSSAG